MRPSHLNSALCSTERDKIIANTVTAANHSNKTLAADCKWFVHVHVAFDVAVEMIKHIHWGLTGTGRIHNLLVIYSKLRCDLCQ